MKPLESTTSNATTRVAVKKMGARGIAAADDIVAVEEPLAIRLSWPDGSDIGKEVRDIAVTMRTPGQDEELAVGFLFTEGIIRSHAQIARLFRPASDNGANIINVELHTAPETELARLERNFYVSSSCGVCGKASIDAIRTHAAFDMRNEKLVMPADTLTRLPELLTIGQETFAGTGSVHAAVLFRPSGLCSEVYEDVGRHNAVDKLVGANLLADKLPLSNAGMFVSGRSSFELVQKARMAGCPMLAAVGAPSSLAIELAWESDMTLVGFVRDGRFNVYAGSARIT